MRSNVTTRNVTTRRRASTAGVSGTKVIDAIHDFI